MKKRSVCVNLAITFLAVLFLANCGKSYTTRFKADGFPKQKISRIAILPFTDLTGNDVNSSVVGKLFSEELSKTYEVKVIEGDELKRLLAQKRFEEEGFSNRLFAQKVAQILEVDAVLVGSILEYRYRKWVGRDNKVSEDPVVCLNARLVDGKSGGIFWSQTEVRSNYKVFPSGRNPLAGVGALLVKDFVESMELSKK